MLTHHTVDAFPAVSVNTGPLVLTLVPALGGKISSLLDIRSGREWLWRHPRLPYARIAADADYGAHADTGGWDECFPSVGPCIYPLPPWKGAPIADHGELWAQVAELDITEGADQVALQCSWAGVALPYRFTRTLHLERGAARVRAEYRVVNLSDAPLNFLWSAHPLLAIAPGMRLELPAAATYNCWASVPPDLLPAMSGLQVPLSAVDLNCLPRPNGTALKLWSDPLPPDAGHAALYALEGSLHMRWDPALLPQIAFWLNLGAWAGDGGPPLYNLGLEPCIGAQDSLADAITEHNLAARLSPYGTRGWWMELDLVV
jgi:hypothetical protein